MELLSSEFVIVNLLRSPKIDSPPGGIDSSESISGLLKRLQIRAVQKPCCYVANPVLEF